MTEKEMQELRAEILNTEEKQVMNRLAYTWAKHLEINWYHAMSDLEVISKGMGFDNMLEFVSLKLAGDKTISLNQFAWSKGIHSNWDHCLF